MIRTLYKTLLLFALASSMESAAAKPKSKTVIPDSVRVERDVSFLSAGRSEKADLYFPQEMPEGARLPAVVWIHGGGWNGGSRASKREVNVCSTLADNGYVAMSIDYKLASGKKGIWPQNLWDCKTAVRWLRKNADRLGIDPDRIGVMGGSAGGHLASMVALTTAADNLDPAEPYGDLSCAVRCCVDMYGIADIARYHDVKMLGKTLAEAPELYRTASPLTYVRKTSPPFLILHGTADTTVNIEQSKWLAAALTNAGAPHELVIIPDASHTFDLQPKQQDLRPVVLGFLDKHLKAPAAPVTLIASDDFSGDLSQWVVEQQPGGTVTIENGKLVIADKAGCTVWFRTSFEAPVAITYQIKASSKGRVSDINCFWMASDPARDGSLLTPGHARTGEFGTYDSLLTYYVGFGGNKNSTTRFRRYTGDGERPLLPENDRKSPGDRIVPDHEYSIRLVAAGGRARFYRDGVLVFDYPDTSPLTHGWFAFRTVNSRLEIDDFKVWKVNDVEAVLKGRAPSPAK